MVSWRFPHLSSPSFALIFHTSLFSLPLPWLVWVIRRWGGGFFSHWASSHRLACLLTLCLHTHISAERCVMPLLENRYWLRYSFYRRTDSRTGISRASSCHAVTCCFWSSRGKPCEVMARMHNVEQTALKARCWNGKNRQLIPRSPD